MSSTILTVMVLVVMWVVVLVPMLVRRTEADLDGALLDGGSNEDLGSGRVLRAAAGAAPAGDTAYARRRRVFGALIVLSVGSAAGALAVAPALWAVHVVADLLLLGCLVWLRTEARRAERARVEARVADRRARAEARRAATFADAPTGPIPVLVHSVQAVDLDDEDASFADFDLSQRRAVNG